jgi:hypothetical protein
MRQKKKLTLTVMVTIGLSACASSQSSESDSTYISPNHYQNYNCNQINAEKKRVNSKLEQMAELSESDDTTGQVLNTALMAFAISRGYGFKSGQDENTAYKRLYNQYEVLEQTAIQKECF